MASKPPPYPPDPATWKAPDAPTAMLPRHFVKATACGQARKGHPLTTNWDEVNCHECLKQAPFHKERRRRP